MVSPLKNHIVIRRRILVGQAFGPETHYYRTSCVPTTLLFVFRMCCWVIRTLNITYHGVYKGLI